MSASIARRVGSSLQPVDRQDREQLIDRPRVGHRLEHREVAEVGVGQRLLEALELLGHVARARATMHRIFSQIAQNSFSQSTRCSSDRWPRLNSWRTSSLYSTRVVIALEEVLAADLAVGLAQVRDHAAARRSAAARGRCGVELGDAEDVDDEHRVVRDDRAARLDDDVRVRHAVGVAHLLDRVDDVVRVLLHRVVHRRREVGLRAVVVDAEAAADVEVLERRAHLVQLDEEAPGLAQRVLDARIARDLRAEVEVQELERVEQSFHALS